MSAYSSRKAIGRSGESSGNPARDGPQPVHTTKEHATADQPMYARMDHTMTKRMLQMADPTVGPRLFRLRIFVVPIDRSTVSRRGHMSELTVASITRSIGPFLPCFNFSGLTWHK